MDGLGVGAEDTVKGKQRRSVSSGFGLLAALSLGLFLRFDGLGEPSYWLDEILGAIVAMQAKSKTWEWLTGVHPQHGPLYYALQLAFRGAGGSEWAGRLPAALFGLAAIPLAWQAARLTVGRDLIGAPAAAALLLATSPLHVYYSREARPYAMAMFLTASVIVALLSSARPLINAALLLALLYTSVAAVPVIMTVAIIESAAALSSRDPLTRQRHRVQALIALFVTLCAPLLYRGSAAHASNEFASEGLASKILHALTVSAHGSETHGRTVVALCLFAVGGAIALWRRDRGVACLLMAVTILPGGITVFSLWMTGHFFATRYLASSLIGFLLLGGVGIAVAARLAVSRMQRVWPRAGNGIAAALTMLVVVVIFRETWMAARTEPFQKLDWRTIARVLRRHVQPGDVIVTAQDWSYLSLKHYLGDIPQVGFVLVEHVPLAERWATTAPAAWFVSAGYSSEVSHWMCGLPLVLSSPLEGFRLHYAPSRSHYLRARAGQPEVHALAKGMNGEMTLPMGMDEGVVLRDGWADAEGSGPDAFRWAVGRRSSLVVPSAGQRERTLRFRTYPLSAGGLPEQTLVLSLNGKRFSKLTLSPEWREYSVAIPAPLWIEGLNELTFEWGRALSPASLGPSNDTRELASCFDWIAIGVPDFTERPLFPLLRADAEELIDARTVWRGSKTNFSHEQLDRESVERLLGRLGYDPRAAWPRIASGEVALENAAENVAFMAGCQDDATFLARSFEVLLLRKPNRHEVADLSRRLRAGSSRVEIVGRVLKSEDFRRMVMRK